MKKIFGHVRFFPLSFSPSQAPNIPQPVRNILTASEPSIPSWLYKWVDPPIHDKNFETFFDRNRHSLFYQSVIEWKNIQSCRFFPLFFSGSQAIEIPHTVRNTPADTLIPGSPVCRIFRPSVPLYKGNDYFFTYPVKKIPLFFSVLQALNIPHSAGNLLTASELFSPLCYINGLIPRSTTKIFETFFDQNRYSLFYQSVME